MYCAPHTGKIEDDRNNLAVQSLFLKWLQHSIPLQKYIFLNRFSRWGDRIYNRPSVNYFECEETEHFIDKSILIKAFRSICKFCIYIEEYDI